MPRPPPAPTSWLGAVYMRFFGTAEARALHLDLLRNIGLFAASAALITFQGEWLIHQGSALLTPAQVQQAANNPIGPGGAPQP